MMNNNTHHPLMPSLFVSHGAPFLALDKKKGQTYQQWAHSLPTPKAILVFSAHWESHRLQFGECVTHNQLIYDFYGFPEPYYQLQYPAPGAEWLASQIKNLSTHLKDIKVTNRGLDHGVWVPFLHMWPGADIPILQMSLPSSLTNQGLYQLGQQLAPLREQGVLIVTSGMITHNLGEWNPQHQGKPVEWALAFNDWLKKTLIQKDISSLLNWETRAPNAVRNHPTPEHFRPLLISAGVTGIGNVNFMTEGFDDGIFSTLSIQFN